MNELIRTAVAVKDGKVVTTSLKIAEVFGREHSKILRAIRELDCSANFTEANFGLSEYTDSTGRKLPMYEITKDGFAFLVFGFSGTKAAEFKEAYIEAFNTMESALKRNSETAEAIVSALTPVIRENERLRLQYEFARHFLPNGKPGELNENGQPKNQYRRGYYTAGKGNSITALVERAEQPGLFDEIELKKL